MHTHHTLLAAASAALFAAILMAAGCVREAFVDAPDPEQQITLLVEENASTKAGECGESTFTVSLPGDITIPVSITQGPATKSNPIDKTGNPISSIWLWSDLVETGQKYIVGQKITKDSDGWKTNRFWPNDKALSFLACSSNSGQLNFTPALTTPSTGASKCTFSYEVNKGSGTLAEKDAQAQEDILFGMSHNKTYTAGSSVTMIMHHALAAIRFKVGTVPDGITLNSISITKVYGKADCSVSGDGEGLGFSWSNHSGVRSYTQTYGQNLTVGGDIGGKDQTFILIPQAFTTEDAQLQLELTIQGRLYTLTKALKDIVPSFDADNLYTFTIGTTDEMDVEITDKVVGAVKSGVEIKNAGFSPAYVRIAIIGYWKDASGTIVIPWTEGEGEFEGWSSKWVQQSDGFYYYTEMLAGHSIAEPPFQKYTLKVMKQEGLKLYFNICVQVIHPSQIDLWPNHPSSW